MVIRVSFLWVDGMALWPFVLVKEAVTDPCLINHERIHLRQQLELGLIIFYIWYFAEYLIRRIQYKNHYRAYRNISFEREAFAHDHNLRYRQQRRWFAFIHYLRAAKPY
ncbi:hypothetical protein [Arsenicibacter rosenii]|uniref:Peptidase M56 domain-containing protein n=1 Tax=Arsenicibacter rosenii TaxID=1750698 RepID=A0A1S2VLR4_9BACT|nr:hypothetical protein [Arsenicibacter rosenii]OIN59694.1 hypothetical protein BLX24_07455 [Arsenicibacter rosenii]